MPIKPKEKWEYGDFQTPVELADRAISVLVAQGLKPKSIIEPTCGRGAFLLASIRAFPDAHKYIGVDINEGYLNNLRKKITQMKVDCIVDIKQGDFFLIDWDTIIEPIEEPKLIIGNPPWVTSSELGMLNSQNFPVKSNFQAHRGYDAITGKSNFDISEWMLLKHIEWLGKRKGLIAMLCKIAVARKVLFHAWKQNLRVSSSQIFLIDAQKHFGASVDACFFVISMNGNQGSPDCTIFEKLQDRKPTTTIGYHDGFMLTNIGFYNRWSHLTGMEKAYTWRSGIKHDCSKVMELELDGNSYRNGFGELVSLEKDFIYPMLKSSDLNNGNIRYGRKYMLVTQKQIGDDTYRIERSAPKTWRYLEDHKEVLDNRGSSIYSKRYPFSIFGVGSYSFSPWKVAISGFYKNLEFKVAGPYRNKSVVLDDTVNFLPCWSEKEAHFITSLLNSEPAQQYYKSMIFWSDKRPITIEILKRLNIKSLSRELGKEAKYLSFTRRRVDYEQEYSKGQLSLGIAEKRRDYTKQKNK